MILGNLMEKSKFWDIQSSSYVMTVFLFLLALSNNLILRFYCPDKMSILNINVKNTVGVSCHFRQERKGVDGGVHMSHVDYKKW